MRFIEMAFLKLLATRGSGAVGENVTASLEYLEPLKDETPNGWIVTGYPWYGIQTPEHKAFFLAYHRKHNDHPRLGSVVGYSMIHALAAGMTKAIKHRE